MPFNTALQPGQARTQASAAEASTPRRSWLKQLAAGGVCVTALTLSGCALLPWSAVAPTVHIMGIERVAGEALERRFQLKLRVQNPNPRPIDFKGLALTLDLNNRSVGQGVTAEQGNLPAHGELLMSLPVTVSAAPETLQMLGFSDRLPRGDLPYTVKGRFTGGMVQRILGTEAVFESSGSVRLPR
jgi:LEA14-like dessication related protein